MHAVMIVVSIIAFGLAFLTAGILKSDIQIILLAVFLVGGFAFAGLSAVLMSLRRLHEDRAADAIARVRSRQ